MKLITHYFCPITGYLVELNVPIKYYSGMPILSSNLLVLPYPKNTKIKFLCKSVNINNTVHEYELILITEIV
jgi:hypothetical protein